MISTLEIKGGLCRRTCSTHAAPLVSCSLPINNNNSHINITLAASLCGVHCEGGAELRKKSHNLKAGISFFLQRRGIAGFKAYEFELHREKTSINCYTRNN